MLATVTDKGQVTVPTEIRDRMGIASGTKLDFEIQPDGMLRVRVLARGSANLFGLLHKDDMKPRTVEEMDEGIMRAVSERFQA